MDELNNILVLSRMTKHCEKAVNQGIAIADKFNAKLHVLHVFHNPFGLEGWNLPIYSLEKEYKKLQENAKADLDNLITVSKPDGMNVNIILKEGEPNKVLFKVIEEQNIDLLIFVSHSQWRMEHFLFGRSNEEIVRKLPCSVMLVKNEPHAVDY